MKKLINTLPFYFLLPAYIALVLLVIFYNIPEAYYPGIFIFYCIITLPVLLASFAPFKMRMDAYYQQMCQQSRYRFVIVSACVFILLCSPLDIYVNGFKLRAPDTYAEIFGIGRYIRHVTILCWIFIPLAFIFLRSRIMKGLAISFAIIFPILIIDRNRFFISCYALFLCSILAYSSPKNSKKSLKSKLVFFLIPLACLVVFSILGHFRSGSAFVVPSSGQFLMGETLPLTEYFAKLPGLLQQIILYITTPIFNFATIVFYDFINPDFLQSQLSPFSREQFPVYPYAPILVERFNVGTEFYPFLLYGGLNLVGWAFLFLLLSFLLAFYFFKRSPNIFTFLIFIRISYNAVFMGFAPQFYILLNLMFFILMMVLWFYAELMRSSFYSKAKD